MTGEARYDYWLLWRVSERCNLRCEYCFEPLGLREAGAAPPIDVPAVLATLDRLGGTGKISFTGGEPLLVPNIVEAAASISEKHYLAFNSNLVSPVIRALADAVDPSRVLTSMASLHLEELERQGLVDLFVEHYHLLREKGFRGFKAVEVAYPPLAPAAARHVELFLSRDVPLLFCPFVGEYGGRQYPAAYTAEEIAAFRLNVLPGMRVDNHLPLDRLCNAGVNVGVVSVDGKVRPCWHNDEPLGNIYEGFEFNPRVTRCTHRVCLCPVSRFDGELCDRALRSS